MKKTLSLRPVEERTEAPALQRKGRGWNIAESRLDTLHENAREMRRNPTEAQAALTERFAQADLGRFRFRRQVVIGSAVVDFACQPLKLVVEIDEDDGIDPAIERRRDRSLAEVGVEVLRFPAAEVLADVEAVASAIFATMKVRWEAQRSHARSKPSRGRSYGGGHGHQR